ncbi:MAG: hypothetical protein KGL03_07635 [Nitrospirota bacterium]|nr:hypothetical protein [Nitrospirota bacterium]MDE3035158.1 hypothetical protein [Nitrospirota bacterium]MDE3118870.1 hypothetical protein [Nitrospirota bacterium]MDE3225263.1 hypothetical protein [Nitrospirota bacterium]
MMRNRSRIAVATVSLGLAAALASCIQHDPLKPRVPADRTEEAKAWKAPFGEAKNASPEIVADGKRLFEGKGSCIHAQRQAERDRGLEDRGLFTHPLSAQVTFRRRSR